MAEYQAGKLNSSETLSTLRPLDEQSLPLKCWENLSGEMSHGLTASSMSVVNNCASLLESSGQTHDLAQENLTGKNSLASNCCSDGDIGTIFYQYTLLKRGPR